MTPIRFRGMSTARAVEERLALSWTVAFALLVAILGRYTRSRSTTSR